MPIGGQFSRAADKREPPRAEARATTIRLFASDHAARMASARSDAVVVRRSNQVRDIATTSKRPTALVASMSLITIDHDTPGQGRPVGSRQHSGVGTSGQAPRISGAGLGALPQYRSDDDNLGLSHRRGVHGIQAIPVVALLLAAADTPPSTTRMHAVGFGSLAACCAALPQAVIGQPAFGPWGLAIAITAGLIAWAAGGSHALLTWRRRAHIPSDRDMNMDITESTSSSAETVARRRAGPRPPSQCSRSRARPPARIWRALPTCCCGCVRRCRRPGGSHSHDDTRLTTC
jgi:hypothetical protein